jgi:dihydropteroate synthase
MQDTRIPFKFSLNLQGRLCYFDQPLIMGIVNSTPDSFYAGSRVSGVEEAVRQSAQFLEEGAHLLDVGGVSTRPGSESVSEEEELRRVIPVIAAIHQRFPEAILSVDSFRSGVAKQAVEAGASIINDISGGRWDEQMLTTIARCKVPYVLMHSSGTPETLHEKPAHRDILTTVYDYFTERIAACKQAGIRDLILDPGIGFGKTMEENFLLLQQLSVFTSLPYPLLLAVSRKSLIYKTLGITADQALNGTSVLHTAGLLRGAAILRVHDVAAAREAIQLTNLV